MSFLYFTNFYLNSSYFCDRQKVIRKRLIRSPPPPPIEKADRQKLKGLMMKLTPGAFAKGSWPCRILLILQGYRISHGPWPDGYGAAGRLSVPVRRCRVNPGENVALAVRPEKLLIRGEAPGRGYNGQISKESWLTS